MMKNIFLIIIFLLVCGCTQPSDKYSNFEKFDLKDRDVKIYEYHRTGLEVDRYALADISKDRYGSSPLGFLTGLFYQTENGDYVLLDEIESCGVEDAHKDEKANVFYDNELYIERCLGGLLLEYSFNKEKINKRKLHLDTTKITKDMNDTVDVRRIEKITENHIYYSGTFHKKPSRDIFIKCSKENLECILDN